jgi:hypothetical protein
VALTDPGRGRYSKAYFGPERYENLMASSRGHSVPVVDGLEQAEGREHSASVLHHSHTDQEDRLELEMAGAYPAKAGLQSLRRKLAFDRTTPGGRVLLEDSFGFAQGTGDLASVLVTPMAVAAEPGAILIGRKGAGVRIAYDADALEVAFDRHAQVEKQYQPAVDLIRVVFTPRQQDREGRVALAISPFA